MHAHTHTHLHHHHHQLTTPPSLPPSFAAYISLATQGRLNQTNVRQEESGDFWKTSAFLQI